METSLKQINLLDYTISSIEVAEIDGMEVGGLLKYFDMKKWDDMVIETCIGDITIMINALEDYARILEDMKKEWNLDGYRGHLYDYHAARCRKISAKYQEATGYDYHAAVEKCSKRRSQPDNDVGEEALSLMSKYAKSVPQKRNNAENNDGKGTQITLHI